VGGHAAHHGLLNLVEGAGPDLTHALARDPELRPEVVQRGRFLGEPARLECGRTINRL